MKIGWDSDGVLYRLTKAYHQFLNAEYGMALDVELEAASYDWFTGFGQTHKDFLDYLDLGVDKKMIFWEGELYEPQIPQNLADLSAAGHTNHLVTYRFSGKIECSQAATEHFYASQGIHFDSISYSKDKSVANTDIFLEDHIPNYDALVSKGILAVLINRPYNQQNDARRRVNGVDEFTKIILEADNDMGRLRRMSAWNRYSSI